jgi:hypothetical protein
MVANTFFIFYTMPFVDLPVFVIKQENKQVKTPEDSTDVQKMVMRVGRAS